MSAWAGVVVFMDVPFRIPNTDWISGNAWSDSIVEGLIREVSGRLVGVSGRRGWADDGVATVENEEAENELEEQCANEHRGGDDA